MDQKEKNRLMKIYLDLLKKDIKKVDHVIGSDELYDINYRIEQIEKILKNKATVKLQLYICTLTIKNIPL